MSKLVTCPYCKRMMIDDPGAYYHRKDCERRELIGRVEAAKLRGAPYSEMAGLLKALDFASDTGD